MPIKTSIWRCQRGIAAVEFAILLPVILIIFLGIIQFASAYLAYHAMTNVTRDAARLYATVSQAECTTRLEEARNNGILAIWNINVPSDACTPNGNEVKARLELSLREAMIINFIPTPDYTITSQTIMRCESGSCGS